MSKTPPSLDKIVWRQADGELVSCLDKLKVLNENLDEIRQMCQDALEDAVLMGCDEAQARDVLESLVRSIENPYMKEWMAARRHGPTLSVGKGHIGA